MDDNGSISPLISCLRLSKSLGLLSSELWSNSSRDLLLSSGL